MISSNDFRNGVTILIDGQLWTVIEFLHVKPEKGRHSSGLASRTYAPERPSSAPSAPEKNSSARPSTTATWQMLYNDADGYHFMDSETYENVTLQRELIGDPADFLKDGMRVTVQLHEGVPIGIDLPAARGVEDRRDRTRLQRRYRDRRHQAGETGNRCGGPSAAFCRSRQRDQNRHPRSSLYRPRKLTRRP